MATAGVPNRTAGHHLSTAVRLIILAASAVVAYLLLSAGAARADDKPTVPGLKEAGDAATREVIGGLEATLPSGSAGPRGGRGTTAASQGRRPADAATTPATVRSATSHAKRAVAPAVSGAGVGVGVGVRDGVDRPRPSDTRTGPRGAGSVNPARTPGSGGRQHAFPARLAPPAEAASTGARPVGKVVSTAVQQITVPVATTQRPTAAHVAVTTRPLPTVDTALAAAAPQARTGPAAAPLRPITAPTAALKPISTAAGDLLQPTTTLKPITSATGQLLPPVLRPVTAGAGGLLRSVTMPVGAVLGPITTPGAALLNRATAPVALLLQGVARPAGALLQGVAGATGPLLRDLAAPVTTPAPISVLLRVVTTPVTVVPQPVLRGADAPPGGQSGGQYGPAAAQPIAAEAQPAIGGYASPAVVTGAAAAPAAGPATATAATTAATTTAATTAADPRYGMARPAALVADADDSGDSARAADPQLSGGDDTPGPALPGDPAYVAVVSPSIVAGGGSAPGQWATACAVALPTPAPLGTVGRASASRPGRHLSLAPLPG